MADNLELTKITNIFDYLDNLCHLTIKNYFILIAVKDTPGYAITKRLQQSFYNLGLKEYLIDKPQCGYIAVINSGDLVYEFLSEKFIGIKCNLEIDSYNIDIHSIPFTVGNRASIVIGTAQCAVNARGFNIVVFDKTSQTVIDSVCFDTHVPNFTISRKDMSSINKNLFHYKVNMTLASQTELNLNNSITDLRKYLDELEVHNDIKFWQLYKNENESDLNAKKRFFYGLESTDSDMKLIQNCISVLFYHFDRICKENKIPYWMVCGSLIGAIRHGKCIPWDDDIDVFMEREDVERLKIILDNNEDFSLNIYYGTLGRAYIKYIRFMSKKMDSPCFIDVFFTDRVENSSDETWKKLTNLRTELIGKTSALETKLVTDNKLERNTEIAKLLDEQVARQQEILNPSGKGTALLWSVDQWQFWCKNVFDYDWIFPTRTVPFAYGTCEVPAKAEEILEQWYGDIYKLPNNILSHKHVTLNENKKKATMEIIKIYAPKACF